MTARAAGVGGSVLKVRLPLPSSVQTPVPTCMPLAERVTSTVDEPGATVPETVIPMSLTEKDWADIWSIWVQVEGFGRDEADLSS